MASANEVTKKNPNRRLAKNINESLISSQSVADPSVSSGNATSPTWLGKGERAVRVGVG